MNTDSSGINDNSEVESSSGNNRYEIEQDMKYMCGVGFRRDSLELHNNVTLTTTDRIIFSPSTKDEISGSATFLHTDLNSTNNHSEIDSCENDRHEIYSNGKRQHDIENNGAEMHPCTYPESNGMDRELKVEIQDKKCHLCSQLSSTEGTFTGHICGFNHVHSAAQDLNKVMWDVRDGLNEVCDTLSGNSQKHVLFDAQMQVGVCIKTENTSNGSFHIAEEALKTEYVCIGSCGKESMFEQKCLDDKSSSVSKHCTLDVKPVDLNDKVDEEVTLYKTSVHSVNLESNNSVAQTEGDHYFDSGSGLHYCRDECDKISVYSKSVMQNGTLSAFNDNQDEIIGDSLQFNPILHEPDLQRPSTKNKSQVMSCTGQSWNDTKQFKVCNVKTKLLKGLQSRVSKKHKENRQKRNKAVNVKKGNVKSKVNKTGKTKDCHVKELKGKECDVCLRKFYTEKAFSGHVFNCKLNQIRPILEDQYKTNLVVSKGLNAELDIFNCNWKNCGQKCQSKFDFKVHFRMHNGIRALLCDECKYMTEIPSNLQSHIRSTHPRSTQYIRERYTRTAKGSTHEKKYICSWPKCGKSVGSKNALQTHMNNHLGMRPFVCKFCEKRFAYKLQLKNHCDTEHFTLVNSQVINSYRWNKKCPLCDFRTDTAVNLQSHMKRSHSDFADLKVLLKKVKSDEEKYICDICAKELATIYSLKAHIAHVHMGEYTEQVCSECNKVFKHNSTLMAHKRKFHWDKWTRKAYKQKCEQCGKIIAGSKAGLRSHIQKVHEKIKQFVCPVSDCGQAFATKFTLKKHKLRHTGEKPLKCCYCDYAAIQRSSINYHMKNTHPEIWTKMEEGKIK